MRKGHNTWSATDLGMGVGAELKERRETEDLKMAYLLPRLTSSADSQRMVELVTETGGWSYKEGCKRRSV